MTDGPPATGSGEYRSTLRRAAGPPVVGPIPHTVVVGIRLIYAQVVCRLIGLAVLIVTVGSLKRHLEHNRPDLDPSTVDHLATVAILVGAVTSGLLIVLYLVAAVNIARGRNWARILVWVICSIGLLSGLSALAGTSTAPDKGFAVINVVLDGAIIAVLALRPGQAWFRR